MLLLIARSLMLLLPHIILFLHLLSASSSQGFDFNKPCQMMRYQAVFNGGFIPLCNPSGEWRELQCHQNECWCVVAETGEEIPNTKGPSALKPDCSYGAAIGALELDMIPLIASNMGNDIKRIDEAFISRPAYRFNPSPNIYLPMKKYMPPSLWQEFSILATVKPKTLEGGFLFAIMDKLESVVQFGLSISAGENDYTQYINVWFTEDLQQDENGTNYSGSQKLTSFVIPRMVDRWSRFAISITQTSADLYVYCHNYTMEELPLRKPLDFLPESLLLVGHAGSGIQQSFEGEILELLVTSDPNDAAKQCDAAFEAERQQSASETELEYLLEGSGLTGNLDTELDDESDGSLVSSGDDSEEFQYPSRNGRMDEDVTIGMLVIPATADSVKSATRSTLSIGLTDPLVKSLEKTTAKYDVNDPVDYAGPVKMKGMQGEKGDRGDPGPPGSPGVNGIPGVEGAVGVQGLQGPKGENGDIGQGSPGEKGEKGEKGKGHKGVRGDTGPKGEQGDSIVGPPGYPGRSFLEELRLLDRSGQSEARSELDGFIRSLPNLTGQKGESGNCTEKIGPSGRDGLDGIPGRAGPPGLPGPAGAVGRDGTNGRQGDKGESGDKGAHGKVGLQGERGHPGAPGETGPAGPPGKLVNMHGEAVTSVTAGEPGGPGEKGETGERGQKGAIGEPGHRGHKGEIGAKGEPGISGTPGFPGKTGLPGIEGESGVPGGRGNKGEKGDVGVGLPGPPGPPGSASRGFSLSDEDSLTKIKHNKRYMQFVKQQLSSKNTKGEKGEAGIPGRVDPDELRRLIPLLVEQGDKGERGPVGASPMCQPCLDTTGSKGPRGPRGYPGSHGRHGQKGNIGMPGFPGLDGIPGRDGKPGLTVRGPKGQAGSCDVSTCQGTRGDQGFAGLPGIPGRDGIPGLRGLSGENGAKGEPGAPGVVTTVDGVYIVPGPPGQPGPPGPSVTGPPGPQGPRGFPGSGGLSNLNLGTTLPGGVKRTDGGVLLFTTTKEMSQSSLAIPVGTLAFVSESQSLYIRINLGWRMIQLGITVPLMDSDITNVIPDYTDHGHNPYRRPYIFRPLNSYTFNDQAQESLPESQTQIFDNTIRLYAVDEPVTGDLDGVSGADTLCYRHAQRAGVEGVFRAVLASRLQKIQSLVFTKFRHLPVVNSKGVIVLKSWEAIQDYKDNFEPLVDIYTFNGTSINTHPSWSEKYFWHGARASGHALVDQYCQAWTSSSRFESGVASTFYSGRLLDQSAHDCDSRLALLCIESHKPEPEM